MSVDDGYPSIDRQRLLDALTDRGTTSVERGGSCLAGWDGTLLSDPDAPATRGDLLDALTEGPIPR